MPGVSYSEHPVILLNFRGNQKAKYHDAQGIREVPGAVLPEYQPDFKSKLVLNLPQINNEELRN